MRRIVEKVFGDGKLYVEIAGLSSEIKPSDKLITGCLFMETDTGKWYVYDEDGQGTWTEIPGGAGGGGGNITIQTLNATANGTYNPGSGKAYKPVYVNVPNSYTAGDEGKVVSGGELVSQTSRNVSANGTVDTTLNNEVVVAVPNTYSQSDEGKVVSGGELVAQGSQTVTENGPVDTTLIDNLTVNVSGGVSAVKLMDHGQVSDTSHYMAATFENAVDFSAYDCLLICLFRESETHYGATNATGAFDIVGGLYNGLQQTYSMAITTTQISCTSYRGPYVDIYVDVYGVNL